jgi:Tfp pilus assembly protein PilF
MPACSASKNETSDNLDVSMAVADKNDSDDKKMSYDDLLEKKATAESGKIPASAVMNWQNFFKAPPSDIQRNDLEKKLAKWTDDDNITSMIEKGRSEAALGRVAAAEVSFRKALRLDDDNKEAALELASLFIKKKETNEAFEFLAQVRDGINSADKVSPEFVFRYRYTLALGYIARNDRAKAHEILSDLIGIDRGFTPAYTALASSYLAIGKDSVAEFVVRRGLDRGKDKDSAGLMNLMGVISLQRKQADSASEWFSKALDLTPTFVPALVNRACLGIRDFQYDLAEQDLKQAILLDPFNVDALIALGITQKKQGNVSGAKAALTKAVDLAPDNASARFNLGVLMVENLKKPNEALRLFNEVIQTPEPSEKIKALAKSYISDLKAAGDSY